MCYISATAFLDLRNMQEISRSHTTTKRGFACESEKWPHSVVASTLSSRWVALVIKDFQSRPTRFLYEYVMIFRKDINSPKQAQQQIVFGGIRRRWPGCCAASLPKQFRNRNLLQNARRAVE